MNVSALVAILGFVALQRNKSFSLASYFLTEKHLQGAFDTLCFQSLLLGAFSASVVLSLWNMELLTETASLYLACECSLVITACWLVSGVLLLRRAQAHVEQLRSVEETATDADYLKLKEQQYERLYYQVTRNPKMELPAQLISELQYLI